MRSLKNVREESIGKTLRQSCRNPQGSYKKVKSRSIVHVLPKSHFSSKSPSRCMTRSWPLSARIVLTTNPGRD
jgi:hypothetical protein